MDKISILIVEDEAVISLNIQSILEQQGYDVCEIITSGEDAVKYIAKNQPDLILMDIILSGKMDGISTVAEIHLIHNIPVIYLTAHSDKLTLDRAKSTQPYGYILKPINEKELHSVIELALYRHKMEIKLRESESRFRSVVENASDYIIILDYDGKIQYINRAPPGIKYKDVIGKNVFDFVSKENHEMEKIIHGRVLKTGIAESYETQIAKTGGWYFSMVSPIKNDNKITGLTIITRDITERKLQEEQIESSLKEKEILIKEIHHRVKNNMQLISSLLQLQANYVIDDKDRDLFLDSQNRLRSMALIHEKLYSSEKLSEIDFKNYISELVSELRCSYKEVSDIVKFTIDSDNINLGIDKAIPCALIIHELVSNSMRHAFQGKKNGEVKIGFNKNRNGNFTLSVSDNGIGIPDTINYNKTKSFGFTLLNALTTQLKGKLHKDKVKGTKFKITFPGH